MKWHDHIDSLQCIKCSCNVMFLQEAIVICTNCGEKYFVLNNKLYVEHACTAKEASILDKFKRYLKKFHLYYYPLLKLFGPVCPDNILRIFLKQHKKEIDYDNGIILNLGSGNSIIENKCINVDFYPYENVQIVSNISKLPFQNNTVDLIINIAVLEHVNHPELVIKEAFRVLKPGGKIVTFCPFMQGFHASPYDFRRFTFEGISLLHNEFNYRYINKYCIHKHENINL